jgi:hypothetical protein
MGSCLGLVLRRRKVESRSSEPPQQIECRIGIPIIPDAWLGWKEQKKAKMIDMEREQEGK